MTGDYFKILYILAHYCGAALADILVRGAVRAVAADLVLFIVFIGKTEYIRLGRHCLMKSGVKNNDLGNFLAKHLRARFDAEIMCVVMQRRKLSELVYLFCNLIGHKA